MARNGIAIFLFAAILVLQACTFTPSHENVNPIKPPAPIQVKVVDLTDPSSPDSVYLFYQTGFRFALTNLNKPVKGYEIWVDNAQVTGGGDGNIFFYLAPWDYSTGGHKVSIRIKVETQSGSLADMVGAEYYLVEKNFTIMVDPTVPNISAPTLALENGLLTLRWNRSAKPNFFYSLHGSFNSLYSSSYYDSVINNARIDHFIERGFVGGSMSYTLHVTGYGFDFDVGTAQINVQPLVLTPSIDNQRILQISWDNVAIANNNTSLALSGYNIAQSSPLVASGTTVTGDTLQLGDGMNCVFSLQRQGFESFAYTNWINIPATPNIKPFVDVAMLPNAGKLLVSTTNKIYRYALPSFALEDSLSDQNLGTSVLSTMRVSPDENTGLVVGANSSLFKFNPLNFASHSSIDVFSTTFSASGGNAPITALTLGNVTNGGLVSFILSRSWLAPIVFDINAQQVVWTPGSSSYPPADPPVISPDGSYVAFDFPGEGIGRVFQLSSGTYNQIGVVSLGSKWFRSGAAELINATRLDIYSNVDGTLAIYNLTNPPSQPDQVFTPSRSQLFPTLVNPPSNYEVLFGFGFDPVTQSPYSLRHDNAGYSVLRLLDINDLHTLKKMRARNYTSPHFFLNNYHLSAPGFIEQVP